MTSAQTEGTALEKDASKLKRSHPEDAEKSYNVFRDTPLRFMGYANEIGESFRYQVSFSKQEEMFHCPSTLIYCYYSNYIAISFQNYCFPHTY